MKAEDGQPLGGCSHPQTTGTAGGDRGWAGGSESALWGSRGVRTQAACRPGSPEGRVWGEECARHIAPRGKQRSEAASSRDSQQPWSLGAPWGSASQGLCQSQAATPGAPDLVHGTELPMADRAAKCQVRLREAKGPGGAHPAGGGTARTRVQPGSTLQARRDAGLSRTMAAAHSTVPAPELRGAHSSPGNPFCPSQAQALPLAQPDCAGLQHAPPTDATAGKWRHSRSSTAGSFPHAVRLGCAAAVRGCQQGPNDLVKSEDVFPSR